MDEKLVEKTPFEKLIDANFRFENELKEKINNIYDESYKHSTDYIEECGKTVPDEDKKSQLMINYRECKAKISILGTMKSEIRYLTIDAKNTF